MQEEVEQRVVTLVVDCAKLTEQELVKALKLMLQKLKEQKQSNQPHGKMTVKQLAAQNKGMQSIEVTDKNFFKEFAAGHFFDVGKRNYFGFYS